MTLTFITNLVHHHQLPVADEFYRLLGEDYRYIATDPLPDWLIKGGYDPKLDRPYIIRTYRSQEEMERARKLIDNSDVVIAGASPLEWTKRRKKDGKVTFHYSERLFRDGMPRLTRPKHILFNYFNYSRFKNAYLLCAGGFVSRDYNYGCSFKGKCFKWGYMTAVPDDVENEANKTIGNNPIRIMWCARFLKLKHPELPVLLAARLKTKDYRFVIDMFGSGEEEGSTRQLIDNQGVGDCVHLCGNRPNAEILEEMRKSNIFLFTSDQHEGWGAVMNESMSNGCVPVASDAIGSVPYLIKNGINGMTFKSCQLDSLENAVRMILDDPCRIQQMSQASQETMKTTWSPRQAAENFLDLAEHVLNGSLEHYTRYEGPASWD